MVFKDKNTGKKVDEIIQKPTEEPKKKESEKETITYEDALVNHEKRIAHLESIFLQLRNSI